MTEQERRKYLKLSVREVARRLNYSAAFISDVEHGRRNANQKIAAFYKGLL